jgi:hypothetical protein
MKKLILITGVANGGKTTTLKEIANRKRLFKKTIVKIADNKFHIFDNSNCDISIPCWLYKVQKVKEDGNLIGTFCIDSKNEVCPLEILDSPFIIEELKKLNVDVYFFVLPEGRDDILNTKRLEPFITAFGSKNFYYLKDIKHRKDEFVSFVEEIV